MTSAWHILVRSIGAAVLLGVALGFSLPGCADSRGAYTPRRPGVTPGAPSGTPTPDDRPGATVPSPGRPATRGPAGRQPTSATHCDCLWFARYKTNQPCSEGESLCFKVVGYYPRAECEQKHGSCHASRPALEDLP